MTTQITLNPNKTARLAGLLYLPPWILSLVAMLIRQNLIVPGDAGATSYNILASESVFRLSLVMDLVVQLIFIWLVILLYKLLKPVHKNHAVLMVILFLVSVPIAMLNMLNQYAALLLTSGAGYLTAFPADQIHALVPLFFDFHEVGIFIAYIFWGLWLYPLGYLVFKSGFLPRFIGVYLMISCFGYLIDFATFFLFPDINVEQWEKCALGSE